MTETAWHRREEMTGTLTGTFSGHGCREKRAQLQVTQEQLAVVAGVSVRCLRKFERGGVRTRAVTVEALFGALQRCSREELARLRGAA